MQRPGRSCETGGRTRQHHRRHPVHGQRLLAALFAFTAPLWGGVLQIRVIDGEGGVHAVRGRSTRPLTVQVTDETGRPVEQATVSFRLPDEGPSGSFDNGLQTEVVTTAADGRAAMYGVRWNGVAGPFQIRVTAARGDSRAGTVSAHYLSESVHGDGGRRSRGKWVALLAAGGGAAAAGLLAGRSQRAPATPVQPIGPPPQIGLPVISIGGPQ